MVDKPHSPAPASAPAARVGIGIADPGPEVLCPDLSCADPDRLLPATPEEQVLLVAEVGLVASLLDGRLPEPKSGAVVTAIRMLPGLGQLSEQQLNQLLARAAERTQGHQQWLCDVACRLTNPPLRRVAFRMAALFCTWDGVLDDREQGYLDFLARTFGLSAEDAAALFAQATAQGGSVTAIAGRASAPGAPSSSGQP
jgi:hypothetical protein